MTDLAAGGAHDANGRGGMSEAVALSPSVPVPAGLSLPVMGWMGMAELTEEWAPELADIMRCFGYFLSAALEQEAIALRGHLAEILADSSLPASAVAAVQADLEVNTCPVSVSEARELLLDAVRDATESIKGFGAVDPTTDAQALLDAIGKASIDAAAEKMGQDPAALRAQFGAPAEWYLAASLELPQHIDSIPPVRCISPAHRRGDRISLVESTYLDQQVVTLLNDNVTAGVIEEGYTRELGMQLVPGFYETLARGQLRSLYFTVRITDSRRSRIARKFGNALKQHSDAILAAITRALEAAAEIVSDAHGVPFAGKLATAMIAKAGRPIFEGIVSVLERSLADIVLPSWVIAHTVAVGSDATCLPFSVMQLYTRSSTGSKLHYAKRDNQSVVPSVDYADNIRFHYSGRQMLGHTQQVQGFPAQLWTETARLNNPICWSSPESASEGFRVLLPHRSNYGNASYVSAVRADVIAKARVVGDTGF